MAQKFVVTFIILGLLFAILVCIFSDFPSRNSRKIAGLFMGDLIVCMICFFISVVVCIWV